ncbi:MAG: hypothetical protein HY906_19300 [Deltaproteobacteria bacterium]|nr:hypothetical protein [Deltaproteobacteria bacterium]
MPSRLPVTVGTLAVLAGGLALLAAAPARAQEREIEIGPGGASIVEAPEAGAAVIREAAPGMRARALSRQFGYYKVRIGKRGQVGWIRVSDTVVPKDPRDAGPADPRAGTKAAPRPTEVAPPPAPVPPAPPAKAPPGKPGRPGKPGKAFEVVHTETVADGGAPSGEADPAAGGERAASRPAPKARPPLVPQLRWAWPPPLAEWIDSTRVWAGTISGVHLGVAGILALLAVLALLYFVYRIVRFIVLLPVRAIRAIARRVGAAARRRREAPKTERPEVQGRLDEVQGLGAAVQASGAADISLHEVFVTAGADDVAMSALCTAAASQEAAIEFPGWLGLLTGEDPVPLGTFLRAYLLEVIWSRAVSFLDLHPLFGGRDLRTERQEGDQESDIAFQFVSPDGLGVNLDDEQQRTYFFLATAIERARVHLPNPYAVTHFVRSLAQSGESLTVETSLGDAPLPAPGEVEDVIPPLCVLLFGAAPFQHAGQFASGPAIPTEVSEALMLHMRAGKPIRYGPAHHAARAGVDPAVGVALVGALSGAMSPAAATLKLRQALGAQPRAAATVACATLGAQVEAWLGDARGRERAALHAAVEVALGSVHLDRAASQAEGLQELHGRNLDAEARRRLGRWEKVTLAQALLHAHAAEVRETRAAVAAAAGRYVDMLAALCERPDEKAGLAAVGFLCAGLGTAAFSEAPDAMKVRIAEAARTLRRTSPRDARAPTTR